MKNADVDFAEHWLIVLVCLRKTEYLHIWMTSIIIIIIITTINIIIIIIIIIIINIIFIIILLIIIIIIFIIIIIQKTIVDKMIIAIYLRAHLKKGLLAPVLPPQTQWQQKQEVQPEKKIKTTLLGLAT